MGRFVNPGNEAFRVVLNSEIYIDKTGLIEYTEYYGAAEPPVRCGESHLSGLTEPPQFVY